MDNYDPNTIQRAEILAFADRFSKTELRDIRNAAQDAIIADSSDVTVTSLGLGGTNGTGVITGKPRYLMTLATAAMEYQDNAGEPPMASAINFRTRRIET